MKKALLALLVAATFLASCTSLKPIVGEPKYSQEGIDVTQNGYIVTWTPLYIML